MENNACPSCQGELTWLEKGQNGQDRFQCATCAKVFIKSAACHDCDAQLQQIQACGSSSYFCPSCNELKSKSRVQTQYVATE